MSAGERLPRDAAPLFAALGDDTRLKLLARLSSSGHSSITELTAKAGVSRQAVSRHLEVPAEAGLVTSDWQGRERVWSLQPGRLDAAHGYLQQLSKQWDGALERLRRFVDDE